MIKIGAIKQIWRYPVKGMAGEQIEQCGLGPSGLNGDRIWALRDVARQEIQSCKFRPELLQCTASSRSDDPEGHVDIRLPDGSVLGSDHNEIHQRLSILTGHESSLEPLRPVSDRDFYRRHKRDDHTWLDELKATFTREPGEPLPDFDTLPQEAIDFVTVPGTFFLVTPFHIITTATMKHLETLLPQADWDIRRFRPNIVIETNDGDEGLVEQSWVGKQMIIADATVDCTATAPRCGAITRQQEDLAFDKSMLRTIVKDAKQNLGVYGNVTISGLLKTGDSVFLN